MNYIPAINDIKEKLEKFGSISFNDNNHYICKKIILPYFIKNCKNAADFNFNFINSSENQKYKYFHVFYNDNMVYSKAINEFDLDDFIYNNILLPNQNIDLSLDKKESENFKSGSVIYLESKSVVFVNSYTEIKHLIVNEIFKSKNTDFLINNRIIKVNVNENKKVEIMYSTTNSQNNYDTFYYDEILIPQILED
jgi:hypothetical protein